MDGRTVEVRRSPRRRRTISARREGDRIVVMVPAALSKAEEERWVRDMVARLEQGGRRRAPTDPDLEAAARRLSRAHLGGLAQPTSVRWVRNQNGRWGSCTPTTGAIRLSHRLQEMPQYVIDYVLLHELAHLLVPGHGPGFWELLSGYPRLERARGFLDGVSLAGGLDLSDEDDADDIDDPDAAGVQTGAPKQVGRGQTRP